ncbi:MAG: DUF1592 domain-containing protein [Bryobacteraceae bacterium]
MLCLLALLALDFNTQVYPVFEKALCRSCHNDNGVGSTTRLQFPRESATPDEVRSFGLRLRVLVDVANPEESLLYRKPTQRIPHGGGERIKPGSAEEATLLAWVRYLATLRESDIKLTKADLGPSKPSLRRLTHSQYNHTVRDLLGEETSPADRFPKEDFVHGFTNQADGQSISPLLAEAYSQAAERLARNFVRRGVPEKYRAKFVETFGRDAFRRPLTAKEIASYERMFARGASFDASAQIVTEAMLQSPNFLFHLEQAGYGVASRLSYFLWDTLPDEALLAAAAKGELDSAAGIEKQVQRMLADERSRIALDVFLEQWLRFDRLRTAVRDRRLFPEFTDELVNAMTEETRRLYRSLVWENGDFTEFFTANHTYLGPELARIYELPAPKEPWTKVAFAPDSGRAGVLGQGLFLSVTSKPSDTSPTERGIFIREHFLCQSVPPPPPGLNASLPPVTDEKPLTTRDRLVTQHLNNQVCAGCHSLVDPIGFGLEKFDAIGRYREKEKVVIHPTFDEMKTKRKLKPTEYDLPIEAKGSIRGIGNSEFANPAQLGAVLAKEPACQKCVVKQLFRYAVGRLETPEDGAVIDAAYERFKSSHFRFQELIMSIASSETFR